MAAVPVLDMDDVLDVVNHYSVRARTAAGDTDKDYKPLTELLPAAADGLAENDLGELHAIAEEAYEVFVDADAGDDVAEAVNSLLAPARPTPRLTADGEIAWEVQHRRDALRAALGVAILDWVRERGAERLGLCDGNRCADAFADTSPAGTRRFCSAGCLNRHKVAEHRRRAREAAAGD